MMNCYSGFIKEELFSEVVPKQLTKRGDKGAPLLSAAIRLIAVSISFDELVHFNDGIATADC